jgi:condensin complex subunit 1
MNSSSSELACLEDFVVMLLQQTVCPIEKEVFKYLWKKYTQQAVEGSEYEKQREESRAALQLLTFASKVHPILLEDRKKALMEHTLKSVQKADADWLLFRDGIVSFQQAVGEVEEEDVMFLNSAIKALIKYRNTKRKMDWFCAAEEIVNCVFDVLDYPERHAEYIIHELSKNFVGEVPGAIPESGIKEKPLKGTGYELANVLFVVGHVGMKMVIHVEKVEEELRAKYRRVSVNRPLNKENKEDELDQVGGGKEAEIEKDLRELKAITEKTLEKGSLLGTFIPILLSLAKECISKYTGAFSQDSKGDVYILENIGINAFCKLLYTSERFCAEYIEMLFDLLKANLDPIVKHNIIISLGDIANRFPNQMERWKQDIFNKLKDDSAKVRRTTLMVLAHLILNDMLKVRGELAEICLMQDDTDSYIQSFVELFLYELNSKGPHIIYNAVPKALAYINQNYPDLPSERFEKVIRLLIKFVDKDKQAEQLIERLCLKLKNCEEKQTEWINISYALTLLNYSEKGLRKLLELYDGWKSKIAENVQVKTYFLSILTKVKRSRTDEMSKNSIEELEIKLGVREGEVKAQSGALLRSTAAKQQKKRRRKGKRKDAEQNLSVIQEENEEDDACSKKKEDTGKPRKYYKATRRKKKGEQMIDVSNNSNG